MLLQGFWLRIDATDLKAGERVYVGNRLHPTPHLPAEPTE